MTVIKAYVDRNSTRVQTAGGAMFFQEEWVKQKERDSNTAKKKRK